MLMIQATITNELYFRREEITNFTLIYNYYVNEIIIILYISSNMASSDVQIEIFHEADVRMFLFNIAKLCDICYFLLSVLTVS